VGVDFFMVVWTGDNHEHAEVIRSGAEDRTKGRQNTKPFPSSGVRLEMS
jgi:hypothetical protein